MIGIILNILHLILLFSPIIIYFIPKNKIKNLLKYYFLILILIPIHWVFFNDQCIFTYITMKAGSLQEATTTSQFSEIWLKWLYQPIMNIISWNWDSKGLNKMVNLHWAINLILVWYYIFFK